MIAPSMSGTPEVVWRDITRYDPALRLKWNPKDNRWEIWRSSRGKCHFVFRLQNNNGSYRPLDKRLLHYLVNCDSYKYKDTMEIAREMRDKDHSIWAKKESDFEEQMLSVARETRRYIARDL